MFDYQVIWLRIVELRLKILRIDLHMIGFLFGGGCEQSVLLRKVNAAMMLTCDSATFE
jgi:hypothetical protein